MKKNFKKGGLPFLIWGINSEIFQKQPQKITTNMKKFFIVLTVATVGFVACNNDSDKKGPEGDTTKVEVTPPVTVDSPAVKIDSPAVKVDSPAVNK